MIVDNIKNIETYNFNSNILKAFEFCKNSVGKEEGRYEITDKIFALVQKYDSVPLENCSNESHRKYIDLQYVAEGIETMGFCSIDQCDPIDIFNEENDYQLYKNCKLGYLPFYVGDFAFFFPQDVHMPRGLYGKSMPIKKIVVKIPVDEF